MRLGPIFWYSISIFPKLTGLRFFAASAPAKSVRELVALAKASPGNLTFASSGTGALIHLTGEMFKQAAGVDMTHVPYKGTMQILPDLLDGRIDMALDS